MTSAAAPPVRRPRFGPRYSLRLLLLAFTAFAIGFPVWYRWPYEEDEPHNIRGREYRQVTTWQRKWGGGRWMHGPRYRKLDGKVIHLSTYRKGILDGAYEAWQRDGSHEAGQYADGKKTGLWRAWDFNGRLWHSAQWKDGRLDGPSVFHAGKKTQELLFDEGRLVSLNGAQVTNPQSDWFTRSAMEEPRIAQELVTLTQAEFIRTPLKDAVDFLAEKHATAFVLDPFHADRAIEVMARLEGMELLGALQVMLAQYDLACDYRYGCLWITSAEDAKDWKDPTGVADIVPPKDSQLARSWTEPIDVTAINQPLADVVEQQLIARLAIAVDVSQIRPKDASEAEFPVTGRLNGLPFKHGLGFFLYNARCRCELRGETLVILPQEAK